MSFPHLKAAAKRLLEGKAEDLAFNLDYLRAALETCESRLYKDEIQDRLEAAWLRRAESQYLGKPQLKSYKSRELEYFCGAMAALHEVLPGEDDRLGPLVPPAWVFRTIAGDNIAELPK